MSSSKNRLPCFVVVCLVASMTANASQADIGCPPTHDGKPLKDVELFDGSPSNKVEIMPENGRFVVPQTPQSLWQKFPASTLGCTYRGSKEMITVVLPRGIQVCDFMDGPQVKCH